MVGIWEWMIRSVRVVFNSLLEENPQQLDDELFATFLCKSECINELATYHDIKYVIFLVK